MRLIQTVRRKRLSISSLAKETWAGIAVQSAET